MAKPILTMDLETLRRRTSAKWVTYPPDAIPAWVAEMDVELAAPIKSALTGAIALGDTGYPTPPAYVAAFQGFAARHWGWTVEHERCALVADVMMGILGVLLQTTSEGDVVVVNDPVYPPFEGFPRFAGRRVIRAPLTPEGRLDAQSLERAFASAKATGGRAAFILCNPHNPTGTVPTVDELSSLAALASRFGVTVISDEIHAPVVYAGARFQPYLTVPGVEHGYAVHSAAKTFSLAALKAGLVVTAAADTAMVAALKPGPNASLSGVIAQSAAWTQGDRWLGQLLIELDANRRLVLELLSEHLPAIRTRLPEATYLMWLDCRALDLGEDPATFFLESAQVALSSGPTFGPSGAGHARLNIATSPAILTEIVTRMASALTR